jgi:hypothetical protein
VSNNAAERGWGSCFSGDACEPEMVAIDAERGVDFDWEAASEAVYCLEPGSQCRWDTECAEGLWCVPQVGDFYAGDMSTMCGYLQLLPDGEPAAPTWESRAPPPRPVLATP